MSTKTKIPLLLVFLLAGLQSFGQTSQNLCRGATSYFSANNLNGQFYQWDFDGDGNVDATGSQAQHIYNTNGTYEVILQQTDVNGCFSTDTILAVVDGPVADAGPTAYVVINSGPGPDPQPTVTLQGQGTGGTPSYSFSWTPIQWLSAPNSSTTTASPPSTILYTLAVTDQNQCSAIDTVRVVVIDIDGDPDSLPIVGNNANKMYVCHNGNTIAVNVNAPCHNTNSLCYHLNHGDGFGPCPISKMGAAGGAPFSFREKPIEMEAFPNPFRSTTTLRFKLPHDSHYKIRVIGLNGKVLMITEDGEALADQLKEVELSLEGEAAGIYFAELFTDSGQLSIVRLVKEK